MAEADAGVQAWRAVTLGSGGLVVGLACFVIWEYSRRAIRGEAVPIHVVLIACSYVLFRVAGFFEQLTRFQADAPITGRLLLYTVGDLVGIVALVVILRAVAWRKR